MTCALRTVGRVCKRLPAAIAKLLAEYDLDDQICQASLARFDVGLHRLNELPVGRQLAASQRVSQQLGVERAVKLVGVVVQIAPQPRETSDGRRVAKCQRV